MFSARQPSFICPTKFFQSSTTTPPLATKLRNPGNFLPIATEFLKILRFSTKFRKNLINRNENREFVSRILPPPLRPKFKTQQKLPTRLLPPLETKCPTGPPICPTILNRRIAHFFQPRVTHIRKVPPARNFPRIWSTFYAFAKQKCSLICKQSDY